MSQNTPVFLLKTRSSPGDSYEDLFSAPTNGFQFDPVFVPVLEHRFEDAGMARVRGLLQTRAISKSQQSSYGALVFTSQRAVEAFASLVEEGKGEDEGWPYLLDVPVYSVGPATTRALQAISQLPPLQIFGGHTGNGESLAQFILEHYGTWYSDRPSKPPLLFLVGEQRRDIIPKSLMDPNLPSNKRIRVDEVVVYGTGEMASFKESFKQLLRDTADRPRRWAVVFSPSGCDSMLGALDMLDEETGKAKPKEGERSTYIATIGPTTRSYLVKSFGFEPDVCAEQPSPEGIWQGITRFNGGGFQIRQDIGYGIRWERLSICGCMIVIGRGSMEISREMMRCTNTRQRQGANPGNACQARMTVAPLPCNMQPLTQLNRPPPPRRLTRRRPSTPPIAPSVQDDIITATWCANWT
ncbi:tetrapyrrole biosynthesis, uroporphyrinogen III synthase [Bombardia bombarda]|uniref:Tetrapyrrole biosynthesis, uroporphyrinogen III synthase n=1 Tax=Bombardia bombarda TaxID=252184 RepID=A0AA39U1I5_9PEZI|nr:tetrapyrrole biosynthesis, uroporphyrinogen III synthase [Bombardia bombarda]